MSLTISSIERSYNLPIPFLFSHIYLTWLIENIQQRKIGLEGETDFVAEGNNMIVDENCKAREANDLHMTEYEQT
jgi:hypothetical protein